MFTKTFLFVLLRYVHGDAPGVWLAIVSATWLNLAGANNMLVVDVALPAIAYHDVVDDIYQNLSK